MRGILGAGVGFYLEQLHDASRIYADWKILMHLGCYGLLLALLLRSLTRARQERGFPTAVPAYLAILCLGCVGVGTLTGKFWVEAIFFAWALVFLWQAARRSNPWSLEASVPSRLGLLGVGLACLYPPAAFGPLWSSAPLGVWPQTTALAVAGFAAALAVDSQTRFWAGLTALGFGLWGFFVLRVRWDIGLILLGGLTVFLVFRRVE